VRPSEGPLGVSTHICVVSCRTLLFICYPCFIYFFPAYLLCLNGHQDRAGIINNKCTCLPALGYCVLFAQSHGYFALYTRKESLHKLNSEKRGAERNRTRRKDVVVRRSPSHIMSHLLIHPQLFSFDSFNPPRRRIRQFPMCGSILSGG
jgi:hypothetical protein